VRSAQGLAVRALLACTLLASVGCFRPKIQSNGFRCSDAGACPDNFSCDKSSGYCLANGSDGGVVTGTGGKGGQGGQAGKPGTGGTGGVDAGSDRPCTGTVAMASCPQADAGAGLCDPVCNTGCGECYQKCSVNGNGALTCNVPTTTRSPGLLGTCDPTTVGPKQTDDCQPGQICADPGQNQCGPRCYQFCRTSSDCANGASCSRDAGGGYSLCDVPPIACDPVLNAAKFPQYSNCSGNTFVGCYLSANTLDTTCDCQDTPPGQSSGSVLQACDRSRDCFPGLVCYDATGKGKVCRKVCRLPGDGGVDLTRADAGEQGCNNNDPTLCLPMLLGDGTLSKTFGFCND
jgi:hypothetical protein